MSLTLRALEVDDAERVHRVVAHPDVARRVGGMPSDTADTWRKRLLELPLERVMFVGAFEQDELLGVAELRAYPRPRVHHIARMWLAVHPSAWRRGVGRVLGRALLDAADHWWGLVRVELDVMADHAPAIALYRSLGFEAETHKRCDMRLDGVPVDGMTMSRIRPGFENGPELAPPPPVPPRSAPPREGALVIRPVRESDAAAFARVQSEPSVIEGTLQLPFQSAREWRERLAKPVPELRTLVAELEGRAVGFATLLGFANPRMGHVAGFGMTIHPEAQGMGVGDAMVRAVLDIAERWCGYQRVQLEVLTDNARAIALYRKHGFVEEGILRHYAYRRGRYADVLMMARVR